MDLGFLTLILYATHATYGISSPLRKFQKINSLYDGGRISLKLYRNHTFAYSPFKSVNVTSPVECAEECMMAHESDCTTINFKRGIGYDQNQTELFLCSLIDTTRYHFPALFKASTDTDFYETYVSKTVAALLDSEKRVSRNLCY